jgi:hypothetical protein
VCDGDQVTKEQNENILELKEKDIKRRKEKKSLNSTSNEH